MRQARLVTIAFALLVGAGSASAQQQVPLPMQPTPPGPYKSGAEAFHSRRGIALKSYEAPQSGI